MTSLLLAGPAVEPVALEAAKGFLRVDDTAEDAFIETLVTAARLHIEGVTGRALVTQTWRLTLDAWPEDRVVDLPVGPLRSLTAITAYDGEGTGHDIPLAQFRPETDAAPARLFLPPTVSGMPALRRRGGIEVDYAVGYGDTGDDVPADLRRALLSLVGYWFENRAAVVIAGSGAVVPAGFDRLVAPYRRMAL